VGIVFVLPIVHPVSSVIGAISRVDVESSIHVMWSIRCRNILGDRNDIDFTYYITQDSVEGYVNLCHDLEATFLGARGTAIFPILGEFQIPIQEAMELVEFSLEFWAQKFRAFKALTIQVGNDWVTGFWGTC
jgi:hypothetical protein